MVCLQRDVRAMTGFVEAAVELDTAVKGWQPVRELGRQRVQLDLLNLLFYSLPRPASRT